MAEVKLSGNCLRGSRPLLSFDTTFSEDANPYYAVLKELFVQIFGVPNYHPRSQPFFDKVYSFSIVDNRIWFRNFQILSENGALAEIGPRFVLNPIAIYSGSFDGVQLWSNEHYVSPRLYRANLKLAQKQKTMRRLEDKAVAEVRDSKRLEVVKEKPLNEIFGQEDALDQAQALIDGLGGMEDYESDEEELEKNRQLQRKMYRKTQKAVELTQAKINKYLSPHLDLEVDANDEIKDDQTLSKLPGSKLQELKNKRTSKLKEVKNKPGRINGNGNMIKNKAKKAKKNIKKV